MYHMVQNKVSTKDKKKGSILLDSWIPWGDLCHRIKEKGAQSCEGGSTGTELHIIVKVCKISVLETIFLTSLTHYGILLQDKPRYRVSQRLTGIRVRDLKIGEDDWISDVCSVTSESDRYELERKNNQLSKTYIYIYIGIGRESWCQQHRYTIVLGLFAGPFNIYCNCFYFTFFLSLLLLWSLSWFFMFSRAKTEPTGQNAIHCIKCTSYF